MRFADDAPWGIAEIAEAAGVRRATVDQWRQRGKLPAPDGEISGNPYWWSVTVRSELGIGVDAATQRMLTLADAVIGRLRESGGAWVPYQDLLALAPEGRRIVMTEGEPEHDGIGYDNAAGPAYDAGGSGRPDGAMLGGALNVAQRRLAREGIKVHEGYPADAGRSFRITASHVIVAGSPDGLCEPCRQGRPGCMGGSCCCRCRAYLPGTE